MSASRIEISALVLDYGEVLCAPPSDEAVARLATIAGVPREALEPAYWAHRAAYDRGTVDGPDFWALVAEQLAAELSTMQVERLVAADTELWTVLDQPMLDWAADVIRTGVPVVLLSNMVREIGVLLRDELGLFDAFAHVVYSYELGWIKPEPEIYEHVVGVLDVAPSRILFVDDREANVNAARALGWNALVFGGREQLVAELDTVYELR